MKMIVDVHEIERENLRSNIKKIQKMYTVDTMVDLLGVSRATYFDKVRLPQRFRYGELEKISELVGVEVTALIKGEI